MTEDYGANSRKAKAQTDKKAQSAEKAEKKVERVVVSEVIQKKRPLGRRVKELIAEADFGGVVRYMVMDIMIPAAKNMALEAGQRGLERVIFKGDPRYIHTRPGETRISYNSPVLRPGQPAPPRSPLLGVPSRSGRYVQDDIILSSRREAELVVEMMGNIVDQWQVVSVADLNEMVGLPINPVHHNWGWIYVGDIHIRQVREGFFIDLPPAEPITS